MKKKTLPLNVLLIVIMASLLLTGSAFLSAAQADADITSGLVGWWKLNETSGTTAADSSGMKDIGTIYGNEVDNDAGFGQYLWSIPGKVGGSLTGGAFMFNPITVHSGTLNDIEVPNTAGTLDFGTNSFSYSMWIYAVPPQPTIGWNGWEEPLDGPGYTITCAWGSSCTSVYVSITDGTKTFYANFGPKNLLNTWTLLTVVVNRTNNTLMTYEDGVYTGNSTNITGLGSLPAGGLQIGEGANWMPFTGAIDDVRIYNRILMEEDIQALYALGAGTATLSVSLDPLSTGGGTVTGGTINCGSSCFQTVNKGTSISITATPDANSYLASWGYSGCPGAGNPSGLGMTVTCTFPLNTDVTLGLKFRNPTAESTVITAASCALADVQAAIAGASIGNTVMIPAGTCTWTSALSVNKPIILSGTCQLQSGAVVPCLTTTAAEQCLTTSGTYEPCQTTSGNGSTIGAGPSLTTINIDFTASSYTNGAISISAPAVVGGFTFNQTGVETDAFSTGPANGWRITDVTHNSLGSYFVYAASYGLIDSCTVNGQGGMDELIFARGPANSWQTGNSLGGSGNLFIEDSIFTTAGYVTDCNSNARCVVRFNTITAGMKIDGHGKASDTPPRGVRDMEVYNNHWTSSSPFFAAIEFRGGTGRVFDNTADYSPWLILNEYAAEAGWQNFDGVIQTVADYPVDDQIGVGEDPKIAHSEPMYLWLNNYNAKTSPSPWPISLGYGESAILLPIIVADRDYFADVATFGPSGVSVGTTAEMEATTPTLQGYGFWVTDQGNWNASAPAGTSGVLYVWNGSRWVMNYTPYPYPHPIRNGQWAYEYVEGKTALIYGDVSGDGTVSAYDSALALRSDLTADQQARADVSGDGKVTAYDVALIAQYAVGLISKFPVEN